MLDARLLSRSSAAKGRFNLRGLRRVPTVAEHIIMADGKNGRRGTSTAGGFRLEERGDGAPAREPRGIIRELGKVGRVLLYLLTAAVVTMAAFSLYLLARIVKIYRRARTLEIMRGYETILYAALPRISPEEALRDLLRDPHPEALEEVLLRMSDQAEGPLREKVERLYALAGFTAVRMRELGSRSATRRAEAARRLGRIGASEAAPRLRELLRDGNMKVREAARRALERMEPGPVA